MMHQRVQILRAEKTLEIRDFAGIDVGSKCFSQRELDYAVITWRNARTLPKAVPSGKLL
jgi:hypothetical protein